MWLNNVGYKNFERIDTIMKGLQAKWFLFFHLVDFFYSLGLEFVAPSAEKMCKKFSCKETC
jgi:hypothetical protein